MKLKDAEKTIKQVQDKIMFIIAIAFVVYTAISGMIRTNFSIGFIIGATLLVLVLAITLYLCTDRLNQDYKYLKEKGTNKEGRIIGIRDVIDGVPNQYYIVVEYDKKRKMIKFLEKNRAYCVLWILITKFSASEVPIDIYVKGFKCYADLESVDLTKIDGYEEAIKLVKE